MNRRASSNAKWVAASVSAGFLTPVVLIGLSWLTAQNFLAEGADTTLSRLCIAPLDAAGRLFNHLFGISGWTLFLATATALILVLSCSYYLVIRWALFRFYTPVNVQV
jgi:hypothetical protein